MQRRLACITFVTVSFADEPLSALHFVVVFRTLSETHIARSGALTNAATLRAEFVAVGQEPSPVGRGIPRRRTPK